MSIGGESKFFTDINGQSYICHMLYNPTLATQAAIEQMATDYLAGKFVSAEALAFAVQQASNGFASPPRFQSATIATGAITIERWGKINYLQIETEGLTASDDLTAINAVTAFSDGDLLVVKPQSTGHTVILAFAGITNGRLALPTTQAGALLIYMQGWREVARWPNAASTTKPLETDTATVVANQINFTASCIYVKGLGGESLADALVTIDGTPGSSGSIILYAEDGSGVPTLIGQTSYGVATTPTAIATALRDNVDDIGLYGTQNLSGASFEVVAPVGTGSSGNSHALTATLGGGLTATLGTFSGGSDGIEAAATLNTIVGGEDGSEIVLRNSMSVFPITLGTSGNIGVMSAMVLEAGDGIPLIYSSAASKWLPFIRRARSIGYAWMSGNATATTISDTTTYFPVAGTTTAHASNTGFTHSSNSLTLTGSSGFYEVSISLSAVGTNNNILVFALLKNGTAEPQLMRSTVSSGEAVASLTILVSLATGDILRIGVRNSDAANNATISDLNFYVKSAL